MMVKGIFTTTSEYFFQTYSVSFSEPWFGQKNQFNSVLRYRTVKFLNDFRTQRVDKTKSFNILTVSVGLARRLTVPDDFFVLSQSLSYQHYDLNTNTGLFTGTVHQETLAIRLSEA
jgi:outer membrane protein insertion porin family